VRVGSCDLVNKNIKYLSLSVEGCGIVNIYILAWCVRVESCGFFKQVHVGLIPRGRGAAITRIGD
jgi:hypothetical protein